VGQDGILRAVVNRAILQNQPLHNHHIAPFAVQLAVLLINSHLAKSELVDQAPARGIFGKDARQQFPETRLLSRLN
jgi:hypothetical protein